MRFGLMTPGVFRPPGQANEWEERCTVDDLVSIARAADALGYHHLTCSDHVAVPLAAARQRGATYWDPTATLAYLAAVTTRVKLATHVLVLGYRHPLQVVKQFGTLDRLSGGRVILGLGVGTLREEFDLIGADFDNRGARAEDAIAALRASWGPSVVSYDGAFYAYEDFVMDPTPAQASVPLWFGGSTPLSLRRALAYGNGWVPFGLSDERLAQLLDRALPDGFEVVLPVVGVDAIGAADGTVEKIERLAQAGATMVNVAFRHTSAVECVEQMAALAQLFHLTVQ